MPGHLAEQGQLRGGQGGTVIETVKNLGIGIVALIQHTHTGAGNPHVRQTTHLQAGGIETASAVHAEAVQGLENLVPLAHPGAFQNRLNPDTVGNFGGREVDAGAPHTLLNTPLQIGCSHLQMAHIVLDNPIFLNLVAGFAQGLCLIGADTLIFHPYLGEHFHHKVGTEPFCQGHNGEIAAQHTAAQNVDGKTETAGKGFVGLDLTRLADQDTVVVMGCGEGAAFHRGIQQDAGEEATQTCLNAGQVYFFTAIVELNACGSTPDHEGDAGAGAVHGRDQMTEQVQLRPEGLLFPVGLHALNRDEDHGNIYAAIAVALVFRQKGEPAQMLVQLDHILDADPCGAAEGIVSGVWGGTPTEITHKYILINSRARRLNLHSADAR